MVRPCPEHGRVRSRYVAKHGRVRGPYPTVYVPYTRPSTRPSLRLVCTAMYVPCTRPCMVRPLPEHGRVHGRVPCTRPCLRPVYSTWPVNGRVLTMDTAMFTARVRGRVPCTCTRLWPVYTAVHGRVQTAYGPCTCPFMTRTRRRPPHGRVYSPCRIHGRSRRVWTVYTTTRCIPGIAKVDNRNLLDAITLIQ